MFIFIYLFIYFNFLIRYKLEIVGGMGPTVGMVSCYIIYLHPPTSVIPVPDATLFNLRNNGQGFSRPSPNKRSQEPKVSKLVALLFRITEPKAKNIFSSSWPFPIARKSPDNFILVTLSARIADTSYKDLKIIKN